MDNILEDATSKFEKYGGTLRDFLNDANNRTQHTVYDYQIKAAQFMFEALAPGAKHTHPFGVGMIVGPTACGKSGIINLLPYYLQAKRVCILTPSKEISEQIESSFGDEAGHHKCFFKLCGVSKDDSKLESFLEPVLRIKEPNDIRTIRNLVIVNAQKFGGRSRLSLKHENKTIVENAKDFFKRFDVLIVDEAHHYPATTWKNIVDAFREGTEGVKPKRIVFLTATPYRNVQGKSKCILDEFPDWQGKTYTIQNDVCEGITTRPCKFYEPPDHDFNSDVTVLYNDINKLFAENLVRAPDCRVKQQALVLVRTVDEARTLAETLNGLHGARDYAVPIVSGKERQNLDSFTNGDYIIGVTCGVGTEGYDNANITICVILRNIRKARVLFSQFVGRCMRLSRVNRDQDRFEGCVLSYRQFDQKRLWDEREFIAEDDPVENDVE